MYYQKYIKYKNKYLNLKASNIINQQGGDFCSTNDDVFNSDLNKKFKLIGSASTFLIPPNSTMFISAKYFDYGTTYLNWNKGESTSIRSIFTRTRSI